MYRLLLLFLLTSFSVHAVDVDEAISSTCLKQAMALAQQLKADVFADMSKQQLDKVVSLSTESCKQQFTTDGQQAITAKSEVQAEKKSSDWFTDKVLTGEPSDKAGNRRLKRLQSK